MSTIEVVPRIRINGVYHTIESLPEETVKQIITEKIELALSAMNYKRNAA